MARKHNLTRGKEAFLSYYSALLPQFADREVLERYLSARNQPVLLFSPKHVDELTRMWREAGLTWKVLDWYPYALFWPKEVTVGTFLPGYKEGWIYSLNPASLLPVVALQSRTGEAILDACAAPGGKTLAIANLVDASRTLIVANDSSGERVGRAKTVLRQFGYDHIPVYHQPAENLSRVIPEQFDRILADVPCSSEKHVFNSKAHLRLWDPIRISKLAHQQVEIVSGLLPLLKPGGTLVYSTCALAPAENEDVVGRITEKNPDIKIASLSRMNDPHQALDPMFVAVLHKS